MISCIYKIYFEGNENVIYVGSTYDFIKRKSKHLYSLRVDKHRNPYLQRLYNKYGKEKIKFEILEKTEREFLIKTEQFYIDTLNPKINILRVAGSALGFKHTDVAKEKIRSANTGRKMTAEQIQKGVIARIGQNTSKGCKRTIEMKKHISEIKKRKIKNITTNEIFASINDGAEFCKLKYSTFYAKLSGRNTNDTNFIFL